MGGVSFHTHKKIVHLSQLKMKKQMKKFYLLTVLSFSLFAFYGFGGMEILYPGGAPAGYSGSPHDGKNCTHCHGGTATHMDSLITSNIPATGYMPGETYDITATVSGSGKKGFEISPQNFIGGILGTLHSGAGTKLIGNGDYITHSSGNNANPAVWHFTWTAPAEGTGDVVFYGAFAIRESQTKLSSLAVQEVVTPGIQQIAFSGLSVYPNPVHQKLHVAYTLSSPETVEMKLFSGLGNRSLSLFSSRQETGKHSLQFVIPYNFPKGTTLLEITVDKKKIIKKLILL